MMLTLLDSFQKLVLKDIASIDLFLLFLDLDFQELLVFNKVAQALHVINTQFDLRHFLHKFIKIFDLQVIDVDVRLLNSNFVIFAVGVRKAFDKLHNHLLIFI